jgi:hypothetical protein
VDSEEWELFTAEAAVWQQLPARTGPLSVCPNRVGPECRVACAARLAGGPQHAPSPRGRHHQRACSTGAPHSITRVWGWWVGRPWPTSGFRMVRAKEWGAAVHAVLPCRLREAAPAMPRKPLPPTALWHSLGQPACLPRAVWQERGEAGHGALLPRRAAHQLSSRDVGHDWQTWRICLAPLGCHLARFCSRK